MTQFAVAKWCHDWVESRTMDVDEDSWSSAIRGNWPAKRISFVGFRVVTVLSQSPGGTGESSGGESGSR